MSWRRCLAKIGLEILIRAGNWFGGINVTIPLWGKYLCMPVTHRLPIYMAENQFYNDLPRRVAMFLRNQCGQLGLVDVGANIGDTIAASHSLPNDKFIAIEANPNYVQYLQRNLTFTNNCVILEVYCGAAGGVCPIHIKEGSGTAIITEGSGGRHVDRTTVDRTTVDRIIKDLGDSGSYNFLKIDTDGHDFEIIKGAIDFIRCQQPALLFECDVFTNENYIADVLDTFERLLIAGYANAIAYDNFGYIFGIIDLREITSFKHSLMYQLVSKFYYYDILVLKPSQFQNFLRSEISFFQEHSKNSRPKKTMMSALNEIKTRYCN